MKTSRPNGLCANWSLLHYKTKDFVKISWSFNSHQNKEKHYATNKSKHFWGTLFMGNYLLWICSKWKGWESALWKKWKMAHLSLLKEKRIPKDLTLQDNSVRLCSSFSHDNILWRRRLEDWCLLFHAMVRKGSYGQLFVQNYVYWDSCKKTQWALESLWWI